MFAKESNGNYRNKNIQRFKKIKFVLNGRVLNVEKNINELELGSKAIIQVIVREKEKKNMKEKLKYLDY